MTKLNWRDASKELPECDDNCVILVGEEWEIFEDYFSYGNWFSHHNQSVMYWMYRADLPLPEIK